MKDEGSTIIQVVTNQLVELLKREEEQLLLVWHTHSENIKLNFSTIDDTELFELLICFLREECVEDNIYLLANHIMDNFVKMDMFDDINQLLINRKNTLLSYLFQLDMSKEDIYYSTMRVNSFFDLVSHIFI